MKFTQPQPDNEPSGEDESTSLKKKVREELVREVRQSYTQAICVTATSGLILMFCVGLLYVGKLTESALALAESGVLASARSIELVREVKKERRKTEED